MNRLQQLREMTDDELFEWIYNNFDMDMCEHCIYEWRECPEDVPCRDAIKAFFMTECET